MPYQRMRALLFGLLAFVSLSVCPAWSQDEGWSQYKQRFMLPEGRVIDTGNHNISHSEGQGFSMLLAVFNNDRAAFDQLWRWTRQTLYRQDIGLFYWRYDPSAQIKIADKNTASDGDILIAWALLKAGRQWHVPDYLKFSEDIQSSLLKYVTMDYAGYKVQLPGVNGFSKTEALTLNPSYFVLPAWRDFYQYSHQRVWQTLIDDSLDMLQKMRFGKPQLPTDWVTLRADGAFFPAEGWPARFSYDAVRIPLYLHWYNADSSALTPFRQYWLGFARTDTPSWINVLNGNQAEYPLSPGMLAIRDLTVGNAAALSDRLAPQEDYYSSSLTLLAWWAAQ